ncbi:hypothetical protein KKC91_00545 [bacterium]|nr:hypothetical protein [bacterium]
MNNDHIYWLFSAAAQSISAFIAFLLTGYALVHTFMENAREKDDTLEEINAVIGQEYHTRLTLLVWITGLAIIFSLTTVFLNRWEFSSKISLMIITTVLDLIAIIGGMAFVVSIVNPSAYEKTATKILKEKKKELNLTDNIITSSKFFEKFLHLERLIREYLRDRKLYVPSRGVQRMSFSFRQMIEALLQNKKIDASFYEELLQINKYRNLVFHGHVKNADQTMVDRVRKVASHFEDPKLIVTETMGGPSTNSCLICSESPTIPVKTKDGKQINMCRKCLAIHKKENLKKI